MTPEEFIALINSPNPVNIKLARDYMDKLPQTDPVFMNELCRLFKNFQPFESGKHLEISERLRSMCTERENPHPE